MDLPPSGWYPDPYGTPDLLRWWDGAGWTQHTHPDVTAGGNGAGGTPAVTAVQGAALAATALQGTAIQATAVQAPAGLVKSNTVQATTLQAATGQPSAEWLSKTKPPTGPPTQPQPALPASPGAVPTGYQPTAAVPGGYQLAPAQPVQPGYPQPGMAWGAGGGDGGTQVLPFGGEPWQAPGGPGGVQPGNPYGYQEAQRRRRRRLMIGLGAGAVIAIAAIAVIASSLGGSPSAPAADQSVAAAPTAPASSAAASAPASPSPSSSPSPSPSASPTATISGSLVADSQSGLTYSQLPAPWQATASCPLNDGVFPWTDGESAVAGQVNGNNGPVTWYGEACSGPLPQSYGYTSTADLQNAADSLASTFENAYYSALNPTVSPGQDTPITVSGHPAWEVTYDVSYPDAAAQGMSWNDEEAAVVVVDNGTDTPAVFFTSIPYTLNESYIGTLVSSLQLNASTATSTPSATATPTDAAQNGAGNNQ